MLLDAYSNQSQSNHTSYTQIQNMQYNFLKKSLNESDTQASPFMPRSILGINFDIPSGFHIRRDKQKFLVCTSRA